MLGSYEWKVMGSNLDGHRVSFIFANYQLWKGRDNLAEWGSQRVGKTTIKPNFVLFLKPKF